MDWFLYALVAPIVWGALNVLEKFLLSKRFHEPYTYQILYGALTIPIILVIMVLFPISFDPIYTTAAIIAGAGALFVFLLYNKSFLIEEASRVIPLARITPLFVAIFAAFFLDEVFGITTYFGIILMVLSAVLISYKKLRGKRILSPALLYILIFNIGFAIYKIGTKWILNSPFGYWSYIFWAGFGSIIGSLILFSFPKPRKYYFSGKLKSNTVALLFGALLMNYLGLLFFLAAIEKGPVSLVSGTLSIQPFFTLLFVSLISIFMPKIIKEKINKSIILLKLLAILLLVIGTWLIVS